MAWETSDWNNHEESKDAWKILKHHTEVASNLIYEELPEILQHSFDEGVAHAREQIARDVRGLVRREYEQVGSGYLSDWQMVKRDDGDYVLFDDVIAAIAKGSEG